MSPWATAYIVTTTTLLVVIVLSAVQFSRTLSRVLNHADMVHQRAQNHLDSVLDRFMALDFTLFKSYQVAENSPAGGFEPPDEPTMWSREDIEADEVPSTLGRGLSSLRITPQQAAEEDEAG